jgi:tRNA(Ile)-lysidine synthase
MKTIEQKVLKFIDEKDLIQRNDRVLVALSGGPDSTFLLHFLLKFRKKYNIELGAVHVNHMIRGKSAIEDEEFCRKLSVNLNIKYFAVQKNVRLYAKKNKYSLEEAGRIIRYETLNKVLKQKGFNKIATAHNCSDNAETVLLNLIKGTGIKGISGIPPKRGNIIRPILVLKKNEILEYLNNYGIKYRIDESNLNTDFERNFLRKEIIPWIKKKLNPDFEKAVFKASEIFAGFASLLDQQIREELKETVEINNKEIKIISAEFEKVNEELKNYVIKTAVEEHFKVPLTFTDVKNIKSLFNKKTGKSINLQKNFIASRERGLVKISKLNKIDLYKNLKLIEGESVKVKEKTLFIKSINEAPKKFSANKLTEYISADNISGYFLLRRWKAGDKFSPLGLKGTKKISDFLNEQKITSARKKEQLVLTNKGRIVWVLGLRLDERFKITKDTERVIELCLT